MTRAGPGMVDGWKVMRLRSFKCLCWGLEEYTYPNSGVLSLEVSPLFFRKPRLQEVREKARTGRPTITTSKRFERRVQRTKPTMRHCTLSRKMVAFPREIHYIYKNAITSIPNPLDFFHGLATLFVSLPVLALALGAEKRISGWPGFKETCSSESARISRTV